MSKEPEWKAIWAILLWFFLAFLVFTSSGCATATKVKRTYDEEFGISCYSTWNKMECFQVIEQEEEIDEDDTYELAKGV